MGLSDSRGAGRNLTLIFIFFFEDLKFLLQNFYKVHKYISTAGTCILLINKYILIGMFELIVLTGSDIRSKAGFSCF